MHVIWVLHAQYADRKHNNQDYIMVKWPTQVYVHRLILIVSTDLIVLQTIPL